MANGDSDRRGFITWTALLTLMGLIIPPLGVLVAHAVARANLAHEKALEAIVLAQTARPDPFTGTMAANMEHKLLELITQLESRCSQNVNRVEGEIKRVERECKDRFHRAQSFIYENRHQP